MAFAFLVAGAAVLGAAAFSTAVAAEKWPATRHPRRRRKAQRLRGKREGMEGMADSPRGWKIPRNLRCRNTSGIPENGEKLTFPGRTVPRNARQALRRFYSPADTLHVSSHHSVPITQLAG